MTRQLTRSSLAHRNTEPYVTDEIAAIMESVEEELDDEAYAQNLYFSPTALTHIKRLIAAGGTIVADTGLVASGIDQTTLAGTGANVACFIDDDRVVRLAEARRATRAETAVDMALTLPGPKLMVVGSAPAALNRLLLRRAHEPLSDVCVLAAPNGFASVVQLKERLRESDMAHIVVRGKKGGPLAAVAIVNGILRVIAEK